MAETAELVLREATPADIDYLTTVERLPGYAERVGAFEPAYHARRMSDPNIRYVLAERRGEPLGFAVLHYDPDRQNSVNLHRFAVEKPGLGSGRCMLSALCSEVFQDPRVARIWLDVLPSNTPARHLYGRLGFAEEGLMRNVLQLPNGALADLYLMALIRRDWEALNG